MCNHLGFSYDRWGSLGNGNVCPPFSFSDSCVASANKTHSTGTQNKSAPVPGYTKVPGTRMPDMPVLGLPAVHFCVYTVYRYFCVLSCSPSSLLFEKKKEGLSEPGGN